jgi:sugar/nucleoside kinase (ribokinase family)
VIIHVEKVAESISGGHRRVVLTLGAVAEDSEEELRVADIAESAKQLLISGTHLERATIKSLSDQLTIAEKKVRDLSYQLGIMKVENATLRKSANWRPPQ